eukprot:4351787-Pyramimonas_sp.AAC.1
MTTDALAKAFRAELQKLIDTPVSEVNPPSAPVNPPSAPANPPSAPVNPPSAPVNPPSAPVELRRVKKKTRAALLGLMTSTSRTAELLCEFQAKQVSPPSAVPRLQLGYAFVTLVPSARWCRAAVGLRFCHACTLRT